MPFVIEKKVTDGLKKQVEKYTKEIKPEVEKLFAQNPKVEDYDEILAKMKKEL